MRILIATVTLILGLAGHLSAQAADAPRAKIRFYVQVIRGSDDGKPPETGAKLVGAKIKKQLDPIFRWKNYWEVQRASLNVEEGKTARTDLRDGHSLEIDLRHHNKRTIHLFRDKKRIRTLVCARGDQLTIQGTDPGNGKVWFIVVRSDEPTT